MQKYKSRNDVPNEYKWDLTDICENLNDYEDKFNVLVKKIDELENYKGCTKDPNKILEFLNLDNETCALLFRLSIYAYVINDQELGNSTNMDRLSKIEDLEGKYLNTISFFNPELLELSKEEYDNLFKDGTLNEFKAYLDNIYRAKEHILPSDKETIINSLNTAAIGYENASQTMLNSLHNYDTVVIDGEEEKITQTNLRRLLKNENKEIRKELRDKYSKVIDQYAVMNATLLNSYVKTSIANSKLHNYKDAWDAKLFNNKMPNEAYETLVACGEENIDKYQKYYKIYKDTVGLDSLDMCDLSLDMVKLDKEYSIEEAQELCLNAIKPLGEDYYNHFKKIFDNRYIDYAQYPGKCSGGYCISGPDVNARILMSYNYDLESASIIIHEGGHNVHHQYTCENNPIQYRNTSTLISEVASLTNECLLSSYIANNGKDKKERLKGIENFLDVFVSNFFSAIREGKNEQDFYNYVNEGNSLTKDYLVDLNRKSLDKYYGDIVNKDQYYGLGWVSISHYYRTYYLYDYSFCISVASYVVSEILNGNKDMLDKYIKFLSTGTQIDDKDVFKILGVDLTDKNVYIKAIEYFDSMLDKFVELRDEV